MKKIILFVFAGAIFTTEIVAQTTDPVITGKTSKAVSNAVALGFSFPIGTFNRTHTAGITADYSRSGHRYGKNATAAKLIKFAVNAGVTYHAGKSTSTSGYDFRYDGYFTLYAAAGIDYKPAIPVNLALTAGPVISLYEGNTEIGAGVNLFWSYFVSKNIAIGPGLCYRKQSKTDALWSGTIRASYAF